MIAKHQIFNFDNPLFISFQFSPPSVDLNIPFDVAEQVEILTKYDGYLKRQEQQVKEAGKLDKFKIPDDIDYSKIEHISSETKDKLSKIRPKTPNVNFD